MIRSASLAALCLLWTTQGLAAPAAWENPQTPHYGYTVKTERLERQFLLFVTDVSGLGTPYGYDYQILAVTKVVPEGYWVMRFSRDCGDGSGGAGFTSAFVRWDGRAQKEIDNALYDWLGNDLSDRMRVSVSCKDDYPKSTRQENRLGALNFMRDWQRGSAKPAELSLELKNTLKNIVMKAEYRRPGTSDEWIPLLGESDDLETGQAVNVKIKQPVDCLIDMKFEFLELIEPVYAADVNVCGAKRLVLHIDRSSGKAKLGVRAEK
ncbi:hypothetical protein [Chitinolyticbacter meiyuanensis]|uniref:hypothetical protein n=1 Tax=Chitinolyticbacter meiyuanensis TaxID=682798 RepID=UPI0011E58EB5|nr:hypothetical protein [Chitinolyticbacter meiyuanensis]